MMTIKRHPVLFTTASIVLAIIFSLLISWISFLYAPLVTDEQGFKFTVPNGASIKSVTHELYVLHVINHPRWFELLVALKGETHQLKAGEYLFPKSTTPSSLLDQITTGTGLVHYVFTIIPGWDFQQIRAALLHTDDLQHDSEKMTNQQIMAQLGQPKLSPEGNFYPDTYYFMKNSPDVALLKRAFERMQTKLNAAWAEREAGLPFKTAQDALDAASLVEKEAKVEKDRPLIAGVIVNRLRKKMPLQLDPTVIYAAGAAYNGTITRQELQSKNPYNTYMHAGLPPSAIAIPSMGSLQATLHPEHHSYLYFVAKNDGNGEHVFSATLAEHNKAVALANQRKQIHPNFFNDILISNYFTQLTLTKLANE